MNQTYWWVSPAAVTGAPCLFLDRDGVVVEEVNYLHRSGDVRLLPGARELIAAARARGMAVGLVTNQAGVGRGYYDWAAFEGVQVEMIRQLDLGAEPFAFVAACGTHPEATLSGFQVADHEWRKPAAGMLTTAISLLALDAAASVMVGDRDSDIEAGHAAGVGRLVHVATGHGARDRERVELLSARLSIPVALVANLEDAERILGD